jgi:hypothetical protein
VSALRTEYEFVLPRGYLDESGNLHKRGIMRLATARDELEPLRDPTISSPDDPRLTILVLARVVSRLGSLELVTPHEIEGLFAADLAYLQDFYGVINFGSPADIEALLSAQEQMVREQAPTAQARQAAGAQEVRAPGVGPGSPSGQSDLGEGASTATPGPSGRRALIEEVATSPR